MSIFEGKRNDKIDFLFTHFFVSNGSYCDNR